MKWDIKNDTFLNANQFSELRAIFGRLGRLTLGPLNDGFISPEGYHYWGIEWARPTEENPKDLELLANLFDMTLVPNKPVQDLEKRAAESPFKKTIVTDGDSM